jgi:uncharacterized protein YndB with AHSA1/START domain
MTPRASDVVTVSVTVAADQATAFAIFTAETNLWWRSGPKFRIAGKQPGVVRFEPWPGGQMLEEFESASGPRVFIRGRITEWQPPARFRFEWRGVNFAPGESTQVEVVFEAVPTGTRVTVRHSGWAALRPDHPVRHGQAGPEFIRSTGLWWGDLMTSLRELAAERPLFGKPSSKGTPPASR